jgi:hypothetical protein
VAVRGSTRHVVAPSAINTTIFSNVKTLAVSAQSSEIIEIDLATSDLYNDLGSAFPPAGAAGNFHSSMGHLLELFAYTDFVDCEVRIDFAPNGDGSFTPSWRRALTLGLIPGVLAPATLIRIPTSFARVTWVNNGGSGLTATIETSAKIRSM